MNPNDDPSAISRIIGIAKGTNSPTGYAHAILARIRAIMENTK